MLRLYTTLIFCSFKKDKYVIFRAFIICCYWNYPIHPQFICIEEPENELYHKLLEILAAEFRHVMQTQKIAQIFITTHQPYFVDGLSPEETWLLEKGSDGFFNIQRASDNKIVKAMVDEGLPLGGLWYSDYMDAR